MALTRLHPEIGSGQTIVYGPGQVLASTEKDIHKVYFPHSGLISNTVLLSDGSSVSVATLGRENAIGTSALFGAKTSCSNYIAETTGTASAIAVPDLRPLVERDTALQALIFRNEAFLAAQAQQTAACNARHTIERRFASWLLHAHDVNGSERLLIIQQRIADLLGLQRASICFIATKLREQNIIDYRRGQIRIVDHDALEHHACECHAALNTIKANLLDTSEDPASSICPSQIAGTAAHPPDVLPAAALGSRR